METPGGSVEHGLLAGHQQRRTTDTNVNSCCILCNSCRMTDGRIGPSYKKLYGAEQQLRLFAYYTENFHGSVILLECLPRLCYKSFTCALPSVFT